MPGVADVRPIVIAIGGSVLAPRDANAEHAGTLARLVQELAQMRPVAVVVGGGRPARDAIATARPHAPDEAALDVLGILATRLNAATFATIVGLPDPTNLPATTAQAAQRLADPSSGGTAHRVVIMGGTDPGHSTDQVAAELAIRCQATRLVIATNVDGVYTADPRSNPRATRLTSLDFAGLAAIVGDTSWTSAGQSGVIDGPATDIIMANRLTTCVVNGADIDALRCAATGEPFSGTIIQDS